MTKLIVFTSSYPYGIGESFFENELPFLASIFEKVVILPMVGEEHIKRRVPDRIDVCQPLRGKGISCFFFSFTVEAVSLVYFSSRITKNDASIPRFPSRRRFHSIFPRWQRT